MLILTDQRGFIPGRYLGENIIEILSIMDKLETKDKLGLFISIEFCTVFDTIEWLFIRKAFNFFNFLEYLIKWIKIFTLSLIVGL